MTNDHTPTQALNWFEIPVRDLDRAQRFYETLFARPLRRESMGPEITLAVFPYTDGSGVGGCLYASAHAPAPTTEGTVVYLNAAPSLDVVVARLGEAGGKLLLPRVDLPGDMGAFVHIQDSEGNRVGLHASR
ncbi:VOC family protein [Ideonella sp. DXS29W]|uniref:VOC family protein n=1 Tax=Ideonella lacteola TaxID=2984193 RepID=A0ABU9BKX0_9BURK